MWSALQFLAQLDAPSAVLLAAAAWLGFSFLQGQAFRAKLASFPRPASTLPVLGNTLDLIKTHRERVHDWLLDECLRHEGRPWLLQALGRAPSVVLTQESHFEDVLKTQFDCFEKGAQTREMALDFVGKHGIFALDGDAWLHQRKTASQLFSHHMLRDTMRAAIADDTRVVLRKLARAQRDGAKVELKLLMDALTTDVSTRIGFGVRLGCLDDDGEVRATQSAFGADFHRAFSRCPMVIQSRSQQPAFLWKLKRWLNVGDERQLAVDMKRIDGAIFKVIQDSMARRGAASTSPSPSAGKDLISLFIERDQRGEHGEEKATPELIRDMALNFIAAGRGTTGQSLAWFFIMINRYPAVHRKVLEELQSELPQLFEERGEEDEGEAYVPTMDDVARLTYLEAAVKESLRLNPAAPLNSRMVARDTVLSDGTVLPKGVRVIIPTYATARLPWLWGDDAAEFKPERWLDAATGRLQQISPFKFLVFHGGPRVCLGIKLAMLEMKIAIAAMLSKFEFATERDPFAITYDMSLSLPIKGELFTTVRPVALPPKQHAERARGDVVAAPIA